jgi:hypothetical protein
MHHHSARRDLLALAAVATLLVTGCSDDPETIAVAAGEASNGQGTSSQTGTDQGHEHAGVETDAEMGVDVEVTPDAKAGANLHVTATGFRWAPEHASGDHVDGEGHAHVYIDDEKLGRLYGEWMHLDLDAGDHDIRVTLNSNDHRDYLVDGATVEASARVTVDAAATSMEGGSPMAPEALAADLCELGERARLDPAGAAGHFDGQLHGPLHDAAQVLIESDAARAGEVLEAKAVVERQIAEAPTHGDELADALITLARQLPGGDACEN